MWFFDDLASLISWAVLMNFIFSMHELKIVLESETSQEMHKEILRSRKYRKIMLSNLIAMNVIIISSETFLWIKDEESNTLFQNILLVAYCIEYIGDALMLSLFAVMLNYFIFKIRTARLSAGK